MSASCVPPPRSTSITRLLITRLRATRWSVIYLVLALGLSACGAAGASSSATDPTGTGPTGTGPTGTGPAGTSTIRLYTSVTQNTVDAVVQGFAAGHPGVHLDVFRATTGQLNARIAAEQRSGGLRADVIWGTDPLSMADYARQHLLAPWSIPDPPVSGAQRTDTFVATRLLYVVVVVRKGLADPPRGWADLASPRFRGQVALPDPAQAGSALAALGYFAQTPGYGLDFYRRLKANGAVQVGAVPQVVTDVAAGRYSVGITLDSEVRSAAAKGSPIAMVWPEPGAIAVYSPIARTTAASGTAVDAFLGYVLSADGQRRIAGTGWTPIMAGVPGPAKPPGGHEVAPDWPSLFGSQKALLAQYRTVFGS